MSPGTAFYPNSVVFIAEAGDAQDRILIPREGRQGTSVLPSASLIFHLCHTPGEIHPPYPRISFHYENCSGLLT